MTDTPPDWVLIEAAKRSGWSEHDVEVWRREFEGCHVFRALCDMIQKYEQPPVDRKVLCAREAKEEGHWTNPAVLDTCIRAIELWEEGFGRE